MNTELKGVVFIDDLLLEPIVLLVRRLTTEYLSNWPKPVVNYSFSKQEKGERPEGPWAGNVDDFCKKIRTALESEDVNNGICQCQWHIQDETDDQYWWIRLHILPVPNLVLSTNHLKSSGGGEYLHTQEMELVRFVNQGAVDLAITTSDYVGHLEIIYLYLKLANLGLIVPNVHAPKRTVSRHAIMTATASLQSLFKENDFSDEVESVGHRKVMKNT